MPAPRIALTFDDGPHRTLTPRVLSALAKHDARATFFLVGNRVGSNADLVRKIYAAGHEIGSHTHDHPNLATLSPASAKRQVSMGRDAAASALPGVPLPLWRAPYGSLPTSILKDAEAMGMKHVSWTLDLRDYLPRATLSSEIMKGLKPGAIVLLHDIQPGTVSQLPWLLQSIDDLGYQMVTVSDLDTPESCVPEAEQVVEPAPPSSHSPKDPGSIKEQSTTW